MAERLKNGPTMGNDNQPPKKAQNLNMKCVVVLPFTPQKRLFVSLGPVHELTARAPSPRSDQCLNESSRLCEGCQARHMMNVLHG
jgi:hypothetical protein